MPVPFDIAATEHLPNWRADLSWPHPYLSHKKILLDAIQLVSVEIFKLEKGELFNLAIVAYPNITTAVSDIVVAATQLSFSIDQNCEYVGGPPELSQLLGREIRSGSFSKGAYLTPRKLVLRPLRRFVRSMSWTPPTKALKTLLYPKAIAITHNSLLRSYAHNSKNPVYFYPADQLLNNFFTETHQTDSSIFGNFIRILSEKVSKCSQSSLEIQKRSEELLFQKFASAFSEATIELDKANKAVNLPKKLWFGSLSSPIQRALAVTVLKRGGETTLFDHGGGRTTAASSLHAAAYEMAISSRFIAPTQTSAGLVRREWKHKGEITTTIDGGFGDKSIFNPNIESSRLRRHSKNTVMYLPTPLLGFRQIVPPFLPDVVLLDWQLRVAKFLLSLPIDTLARPHPEGILPAHIHPIQDMMQLSRGKFQSSIEYIDHFIFEYPHSTAFWQATCTELPITLINLKNSNLSSEIQDLVSRRCRIVDIEFDKNNIPQFDKNELTDAILYRQSIPDPTEFRSLFTVI